MHITFFSFSHRRPPAEVIFSRQGRCRAGEDGLDGDRAGGAGQCSLLSVVLARRVLQAGQQGAVKAPNSAADGGVHCRVVADRRAALGRLQPWGTALQGPRLYSFIAMRRTATSSLSACSSAAAADAAAAAVEVVAAAPAGMAGGAAAAAAA